MKLYKKIISRGKIYTVIIPVCIFMLYILLFADSASRSIRYGLTVCGEIVIPALFPFTCISLFIYSSDISKIFNKIFDRPMKLLGLNGSIGTIILMSFIGGYPVGGKLISKLYNDGIIDDRTANLLLMFCVNPGPSFVIVAVGCGMLKSYKAGIIIFSCSILSSIIMCIVLSLTVKHSVKEFNNERLNYTDAIVKSISDTTSSILAICGYVVFFCSVSAAVDSLLSKEVSSIIMVLTEVTNGCMQISRHGITACSFAVAFAGLAVHFQIFAFNRKAAINHKQFYLGRIIHSVSTAFLTFTVEKIFPITTEVGNFGTVNKVFTASGTSVCSLALICMSFIMMCYWYLLIKDKKNAL